MVRVEAAGAATTYKGVGLRVGSWYVTVPLGAVTLDDYGLEVGLRWRIPVFRARRAWTEITKVEPVRGVLPLPGNRGLRFQGREPIWCG
jgi:hypothetical protein